MSPERQIVNNEITAEEKKALIQKAVDARSRAYAPYSKYKVGAALLTSTGKV